MITKAQSLFYSVYWSSSSTTHFIFRRITPLGVLFLLLVPVILIVFVTYYQLATLYLFSFLCGVFLFSSVAVFFKLARVHVERELPEVASVGEEFTYMVRCRNLGLKKLSAALLHDLPVDSRPTREEFVHSREPQEELRNGFDRLFAYYRWLWLCKKKTKFESKEVSLSVIAGGGEEDLILKCKPMRRGRLEFGNAWLYLPEPLYLLQKCVRVGSGEDSILVLPRRYKLPEFLMDGGGGEHLGGLSQSYMAGVSDDFRGLRAYRSGDSPKHIDWASWARTGKPVVREYENVFFPRYALVLDTNGAFEDLDCFEEAVSIAASFARVVDSRECLLDLIFLNKGAQTLTVGRGVARSGNLLEHLATLELEVKPDWMSLSQQVLRHSASFSICVVIFTKLSEEREKLVRGWRAAGLNMLILVIVNNEDTKQRVIRLGATPIRVNDVQRDLLNML